MGLGAFGKEWTREYSKEEEEYWDKLWDSLVQKARLEKSNFYKNRPPAGEGYKDCSSEWSKIVNYLVESSKDEH